MLILSSIESLDKENIIDTQNKPIRIHASDGEYYICKYHTGIGTADRLFKELLASRFIERWGFPHSENATIKVEDFHIPPDLTLPKKYFIVETFGSKIIKGVQDLHLFSEDSLARIQDKSLLRELILTIAFFDIWMANEDRHFNNYNLLFTLKGKNSLIYPIDHEACFNHGNFNHGIQIIQYEETLIYSTFFRKMFTVRYLRNKMPLVELEKKIYLCIQSCKENLSEILEIVPLSWSINTEEKRDQLNTFLFNDEWFRECWITFLSYIMEFITVSGEL